MCLGWASPLDRHPAPGVAWPLWATFLVPTGSVGDKPRRYT